MDISNITFYNYKYKIEKFLINAPTLSKPYEVSDNHILSFELEKNFDTHILPYFEFNITIPNGVRRALTKANNDIKVNLIIKYAKLNSEKYNIQNNESVKYIGFLNGVFKLFMDDQDPSLNERYQKDFEKKQGLDDTSMDSQNMSMMKVVLYNEMYFNGTKTIVNDIVMNANLIDVVTYILNKSNMKNILISPPYNNTLPSQFVITPMTVMEQLEYLTDEYALHKNGTLIFFDIDRAYILDKSPKCTAYQLNEFKKTYLLSLNKDKNSTNFAKTGSSKVDKEKYNICLISSEGIESTSNYDFNKQVHGNNLIYIDSATGDTSTINTDGGKVDGVVYSKRSSTASASALQNSLNEEKKVVNLYIQNTDLNFLTPNKEFIISTDSSKSSINGSYRITKQSTTFKKDGREYTSTTLCEFKGY